MSIRKIKTDDFPVIEKLETEIFPEERLNRDPSTKTIVECCTLGRGYLYEDEDGATGGYILYSKGKNPYIYSVGVSEKFRGKGVAQALFQQFLVNFRNCEIYLHVKTDNQPAIHIYEKLGFKRVKRVSKRFGTKDAYLYKKCKI